MEQKFFLYARKSTDVEDKQVLSIEAQLTELRAFAKQEGLHIAEELIEKQSAKIPGRPIFNKMILRIEHGDANGILAWHRLARNSVDGGRIIYRQGISKTSVCVGWRRCRLLRQRLPPSFFARRTRVEPNTGQVKPQNVSDVPCWIAGIWRC